MTSATHAGDASACAMLSTLFDLIDDSDTMEVDGVAVADYTKVVDHCYLCDLCYNKMPYVPPMVEPGLPSSDAESESHQIQKGYTKFRTTSSPALTWLAKRRPCHWSTRWSTAETKTARCEPHWTGLGIHKDAAAGIPQTRPQATCGENIQPAGQLGLWEQRYRH